MKWVLWLTYLVICFPFLRGLSFNAEPYIYISLSQQSSFSVKWPQSVFEYATSLKSGISKQNKNKKLLPRSWEMNFFYLENKVNPT